MRWRKDNIWQLEIDDLLKSNIVALQAMFKMFFITKKTKVFSKEDAVQIFSHMADLGMLDQLVIQCWGLSKMTIENDIKQRDKYDRIVFVEFLELFCRVAEQAYKDSYLHRNASFLKKI